jgi:predicted nucleotidyltransferase
MNQELYLSNLISEMLEKHNCHSIILYGSRADNSHNEQSDIDIVCFTENSDSYTDCRLRDGIFLDAWIYPESYISNLEHFLKLINGKVLIQKDKFGEDLLEKVKELFERGSEKLSASERELRITWCKKTLLRIKRKDIEGNYRKIWLINDLLPMYFELRNKWYRGPKVSFAWLKENKPEEYKVFELLFANPESEVYLDIAVDIVINKIGI